jgi:P63C domain
MIYTACMTTSKEASMSDDDTAKKAKGGFARALALSSEERKDIARKAASARWDHDLPLASHEGDFDLGSKSISCAVLPNGKRLITQAAFLRTLGRSRSPKAGTGVLSTAEGLPFFLQAEALQPFISDDLKASTTPIFYRTKSGGKGVGYDALLLPQVAEVYLKFRDAMLAEKGSIPTQYKHIIEAADILMRGLANVGIIALVDEATGYQRDRAKDALEKILEAFIAKELRPWVKTFPDEYYAQIFRLRGMTYPRDTVKKPQYFGLLTNDIVYRRLAPGVLEELRNTTPRGTDGRLKHHLHRRLTEDMGHPKLREHLASVVTIMKLSRDYDDFKRKLDQIHVRFGENYELSLEEMPEGGL